MRRIWIAVQVPVGVSDPITATPPPSATFLKLLPPPPTPLFFVPTAGAERHARERASTETKHAYKHARRARSVVTHMQRLNREHAQNSASSSNRTSLLVSVCTRPQANYNREFPDSDCSRTNAFSSRRRTKAIIRLCCCQVYSRASCKRSDCHCDSWISFNKQRRKKWHSPLCLPPPPLPH